MKTKEGLLAMVLCVLASQPSAQSLSAEDIAALRDYVSHGAGKTTIKPPEVLPEGNAGSGDTTEPKRVTAPVLPPDPPLMADASEPIDERRSQSRVEHRLRELIKDNDARHRQLTQSFKEMYERHEKTRRSLVTSQRRGSDDGAD